jgi:hypothetical protein
MKRLIRTAVICAGGGLLALTVSVASGGAAFAARNPLGTGQPFLECEDPGAISPGNASMAPGSPFNEDGIAGSRYAGEQPQNSKNKRSVSQYDVACFRGPDNH